MDLGVPSATEAPWEWGAPLTAGGPRAAAADPAWGTEAHPKAKPRIQIHGQAWNSEDAP